MSKSEKESNYEQLGNKKSVFHSLDCSSNSETETNPAIMSLSEEYDQDNKAYKHLSDIRKYNTPLLSEHNHKYRGEIACRESSNSCDTNSIPRVSDSETEFQHEGTDTSLDHSDNCDSNKEVTTKGKNLVPNLNTTLEVKKAICVQNQLTIWEKLLEARIHSQRILNKANNLPYPNKFQLFSSYKEYSVSAQETKQHLEVLLERLIETKIALAMQFSEIKKLDLNKQRKKSQNGNTNKFDVLIKSNFEKFKPYRNSILLKWEDRTKLLASHNASKTRGPLENLNIVKNINNHLTRLNGLITHTQTIKAYNRPPERQANAVENKCTQHAISHVQIYDDTDFYHSQLRELIEHKTNASTNSYELNTQFSELQKLRQKMKRKVDTRASKGRKIRYMVHNKLINFMGSKSSSNWTEESKSELYKSLFLT